MYSDKFDDDLNRLKSYVGEALGKAYSQLEDATKEVYNLRNALAEAKRVKCGK